MKVGTDGVLLGCWTSIQGTSRILDIGTGTGVIALILAQRTTHDVPIEAVEINQDAVVDAAENFRSSPWSNRIILHHMPIQQFKPEKKFDLIITNPPYFINSYKPPDSRRQEARHTDTLSFDNLLKSATDLLSLSGRMAIVLPLTEGKVFAGLATSHALHLNRICEFRSREHKPVERLLMEFSYSRVDYTPGKLCLYDDGEEWTTQYKALTGAFYLKG